MLVLVALFGDLPGHEAVAQALPSSTNATTVADTRELPVLPPSNVTHGRRLLAGRSAFPTMRRGAGKGSGRAASAAAAESYPLPVNASPTERVCYPLAPQERRKKQGQVVEGTSFGAALSAIAALPGVKRVLELGTWYGGGSTVNLARGIRDSAVATIAQSLGATAAPNNCIEQAGQVGGTDRCCHSLVVTVEVFEPAWEHARRYLRDWPVWCVRGSTVAADEMLQVRRAKAALCGRWPALPRLGLPDSASEPCASRALRRAMACLDWAWHGLAGRHVGACWT